MAVPILSTQTVFAAPPPIDGAFSTASAQWEGYSEFIRLAQRRLGRSRILLTSRLDYSTLTKNDALVVIRPLVRLDDSSISAFLSDGGRVALLDDYGTGDSLLKKFGISRTSAPADPLDRIRNDPDLAIAVPSLQRVAGVVGGRHPITRDVESVVTNHPRALKHPDLTPVIEIRDNSGLRAPIAITGVIAKRGRLFALADPSVFINLMLRYPGNRAFAEGLVNYLSERSSDPSSSTKDIPNEIQGTTTTLDTVAPLGSRAAPTRIIVVSNNFEQIGRYGKDESLQEKIRDRWEQVIRSANAVREDGFSSQVATLLAALLAAWALARQLKENVNFPLFGRQGQAFALLGQSPFTRQQTGPSPETVRANPILAIVELDSTLRSTLHKRLGINSAGTGPELKSALENSILEKKDIFQLMNLLRDLRIHSQTIGSDKPPRISPRHLLTLHEESMRLLAIIEKADGNA